MRRAPSVTRIMSDIKLSDFTILGKLGEGGFGTVLLARLKATGTLYAIKLLLKRNMTTTTQAERVLREAKAMQEAGHPFIVQLHGAFQDDQYVYFVLEYMGGGDLFSHMSTLGTALTEEQARIVAAETALALEHLHSLGYMYRDLKTENLLIANDGHLKLADFGLVKKFQNNKSRPTSASRQAQQPRRMTPRHSRVGTPDAVAPEVMGVGVSGDYGYSVDWWAFGILIAELLLAMSPLRYSGESEQGMKQLLDAYRDSKHLRQDVVELLSPDAADIVLRLLTVDVEHRMCCSSNSIEEMHNHPFFQGIDWEALARKEVESPLPSLLNQISTSTGSTPLTPRFRPHDSQKPRNAAAIQTVEDNFIEFLNAPTSELQEAAALGNVEMLRELVSGGTAGTCLDDCDYDRRTVMHIAATEGQLEAVRFLLNAGAQVSPIDRWGNTPFDDATTNKHTAVAELLAAYGAEPSRRSAYAKENPQGALCDAASKGDIAQLRSLVKSGLDVNEGDYDRRTALHLAASEGLLEAVQFLVHEAKANPSPVDRWGGTPLDDANRSRYTEVSNFLVTAGGKMGRTSELAGTGNGNGPSAGHAGLTLNGRNPAQLLCDAASKGDIAQLRMMVAHGLDVNDGDYDRRTALHLAASEGVLEAVQFLIGEAKADNSPIDRWGGTPLDDAIRSSSNPGSGHHATVVFLKAMGAKRGATASIREQNISADLCAAAHTGDVARLRRLVVEDGADVDSCDYDARTAMHLAASEGHIHLIETLICELHAKVNPRDRWGNTPLDDAHRSSHMDAASRLEGHGGKTGAEFVGNSGYRGNTFAPSENGSVHSMNSTASSTACAIL